MAPETLDGSLDGIGIGIHKKILYPVEKAADRVGGLFYGVYACFIRFDSALNANETIIRMMPKLTPMAQA